MSSNAWRRTRGSTVFPITVLFSCHRSYIRKLYSNHSRPHEGREPPDVFILADVLPYGVQVCVCVCMWVSANKGSSLALPPPCHHHPHPFPDLNHFRFITVSPHNELPKQKCVMWWWNSSDLIYNYVGTLREVVFLLCLHTHTYRQVNSITHCGRYTMPLHVPQDLVTWSAMPGVTCLPLEQPGQLSVHG